MIASVFLDVTVRIYVFYSVFFNMPCYVLVTVILSNMIGKKCV